MHSIKTDKVNWFSHAIYGRLSKQLLLKSLPKPIGLLLNYRIDDYMRPCHVFSLASKVYV